jgi:hypothetical protein
MIDQRTLREIMHYSPETGVWTWRVRMSSRYGAGDVAGWPSHEYLAVCLFGNFARVS